MQEQPQHNHETIAWETLSGQEISQHWGVDPGLGLTHDQAIARLRTVGANRLGEAPRPLALSIFLRQFQSAVVLLLLLATLISLWLGEYLDAAAIFAALLLNATIGFVIEYQASNSLAALKELAVLHTRCLRDGQEEEIPTHDLVPGDILLLEGGDRIPADGRILNAERLLVDEAQLTGESFPVEKGSNPLPTPMPLAERNNMLFLGSTVLEGTARMVVTGTGYQTELGKIGKLLTGPPSEIPLERRLNELGNHLLALVGMLALIITGMGILHGESLGLMLETGIAMAIAAIPEGLPVVATITLAVGMQRMVKRRVLIRQLASVETLGSVTVICSDKTGTMTNNVMTVQEIVTLKARYLFEGEGYEPTGKIKPQGNAPKSFRKALEIAVLANDATLEYSTHWHVHGDPSEAALLVAAQKAGIDREALNKQFPRLYELPFESRRKRMTVVCQQDSQQLAYSKGALEVILPSCTQVFTETGLQELTPWDSQTIQAQAQGLVEHGLRVLALATKRLGEGEAPEEGLIYVGLAAMMDPPKRGVKEAIRECHEAGISVRMITGDHPVTAKAVAESLNLTGGREARVMVDPKPGEDLTQADIFARTTSEAKLLIVEALKKQGEIVAMTGDGVNDAPALRKADIGVAMGSGSDVAKEASAMILMDNDFSSIVDAVREGRIIYANIRRATMFLLTASFSVMALITVAIIGNLGLPLLPLQILWQNLLIHVFPALGLALQPGEDGEMQRPPLSPHEALLSKRVLGKILWGTGLVASFSLGVYLWGIRHYGNSLHATSLALGAIVLSLVAWSMVSRSERPFQASSNPALWLAISIVVLLQGMAFYLPAANAILRTVPLQLSDLGVILFAALGVWVAGELLKMTGWDKAPKPPERGSPG